MLAGSGLDVLAVIAVSFLFGTRDAISEHRFSRPLPYRNTI